MSAKIDKHALTFNRKMTTNVVWPRLKQSSAVVTAKLSYNLNNLNGCHSCHCDISGATLVVQVYQTFLLQQT